MTKFKLEMMEGIRKSIDENSRTDFEQDVNYLKNLLESFNDKSNLDDLATKEIITKKIETMQVKAALEKAKKDELFSPRGSAIIFRGLSKHG